MQQVTVSKELNFYIGSPEPGGQYVTFTSLTPSQAILGGAWTFRHSGLTPLKCSLEWPPLPADLSIVSLRIQLGSSTNPSAVAVREWTDSELDGLTTCLLACSVLGHPSTLVATITATILDRYVAGVPQVARPHPPQRNTADGGPALALGLVNAMLDSPSVGDVCFRFTRCGQTRHLWAHAATLREISPYFKALLSEGFLEGNLTGETPSTSGAEVACSADDSDDETDTTLPEAAVATSPTHPFHTIDVTAHAYSTYRAVLCWTITSHIQFATLTSVSSQSDLTVSSNQEGINSTMEHGAFPGSNLVSPKSVYRLAHFLELEPLKSLALDAIKSNLAVENVLEELLGETARFYQEIREVEMDFAMKNWGMVKKQKGVEQLLETMEEGSTEWVFLRLAIGV
ncbi:hypothetical protein RQP46_010077 [Phenoliferia psychrophenolica]